jgi:peptide/nickel transport system ATP-binding protein
MPAHDGSASGASRFVRRRGARGGAVPLAGITVSDRPVAADQLAVPASSAMLEVRDLRIHFPTDDGIVKAVDGVSFSLDRGKTLGIVGESGSGKSVTSLGILGLHQHTRAEISGSVLLDGENLITATPERVRSLRGSKMAMIFQDPLSALHPYFTVGRQISEAYLIHNKVGKKQARQHAIDMLGRVGIPQPATRIDDYPHQFSGGMRQRAMIAMALSCDPELLIADEPTTALDVTVQAQILDLISDLQREFGSAVIIITHDLGVVAELSDDILVMYSGRVSEYGSAEDIFLRPGHPYTWGLLTSMPRLDEARAERLIPIKGTPPSLINVPSGCPFHPRCDYAGMTDGRSATEVPLLREITPGHLVACHLTGAQRERLRASRIGIDSAATTGAATTGAATTTAAITGENA